MRAIDSCSILFFTLCGCVVIQTARADSNAPINTAAPSTDCIFQRYVPTAAQPYRVEDPQGYGTYEWTQGVELYIPAQDGLTRQWLELSIKRVLDTSSNEPGCAPAIQKLRVQVISAGNGFWVLIVAKDEQSAHKLLHWAQTAVSNTKSP